ncbi:unnamed protein product [Mytilus coruscus]|uniref:C1q domain-containing protein n=1 Tax=Mytilus coruscus TaxID=42192 RepID=A0A6J8DDP5_MYTCO|nr:unnamed protein product [Mytilus coruscus]
MMMYTVGIVILLCSVMLGSVHAQFTSNMITMDSDVYCGKAIDVYDREFEYVINARADVTTSNPNYRCVITIRSGYTDSYYGIQITQQMVDIKDYGVKLNIYEGSSPGGTAVKILSCSTKRRGILYSKYGIVTFELITPVVLYNPRNDFNIKVKAFLAMTACLISHLFLSRGSVVKFDDIKTHTGISNLSSFRNSGKFTSENEGLYLVSSWILSHTNRAQFAIYCNGNSLASAYVMYDGDAGTNIGTATAVVAVELKEGDTVWVQTKTRMQVGRDGSCLKIAKLK